jgi:hypothetical protein
VREPNLPRAFKVPGGLFGVILVALCPTLLLAFSVFRGDHEEILGMSSLVFGVLLMGAGVVAYGLDVMLRPVRPLPPAADALE